MRTLRTTFTLAALALHVALAQAQVDVNVRVGCFNGFDKWDLAHADTPVSIRTYAGACDFDFGPNGIRGTGAASAGGFANYTTQKAQGGAVSTGRGGGIAETQIQVGDAISINVPSYVGYVAVTYGIYLAGSTTVAWAPEVDSYGGYAQAGASVRASFLHGQSLEGSDSFLEVISGRYADQFGLQTTNQVNGRDVGSVFGWHWMTTLLLANAEQQYQFDLLARANSSGYAHAYKGGDGYADYSLGNSVYWAGIKSVTTPDGVPLDFTVSSASGTDYSRSYVPVPEPATTLLMALGLAALSLRRSVAGRVACRSGSLPSRAALGMTVLSCSHLWLRWTGETSSAPLGAAELA